MLIMVRSDVIIIKCSVLTSVNTGALLVISDGFSLSGDLDSGQCQEWPHYSSTQPKLTSKSCILVGEESF